MTNKVIETSYRVAVLVGFLVLYGALVNLSLQWIRAKLTLITITQDEVVLLRREVRALDALIVH